jgi:hypothetical protein
MGVRHKVHAGQLRPHSRQLTCSWPVGPQAIPSTIKREWYELSLLYYTVIQSSGSAAANLDDSGCAREVERALS